MTQINNYSKSEQKTTAELAENPNLEIRDSRGSAVYTATMEEAITGGLPQEDRTVLVDTPTMGGTTTGELPPEDYKKPPSKKKWWLPLIAVLLLAGGAGGGWLWWQRSHSAAKPPAGAGMPQMVPVKLQEAQTTNIEDSSEYPGTLEATEAVDLRSELDGNIRQIYVKAGDSVAEGDVVARLESTDLEAQLRSAKANQAAAEARLKELEAGSRPEEIARAKAAVLQAEASLQDATTGARPAEIAQAEAQLESAKADADLASQRVSRYQDLAIQGVISQDTLDQYVKENRSAEAKLNQAQKRLEEVNKSRGSEIERLKAALEQQQQALNLVENGTRPEQIEQAEAQVAQAVAQVRNIEAAVAKSAVIAPFTGKIGDMPVKVGDYVKKGDKISSLTQNSALELRISVPLERANQLREGLPVQMLDSLRQPIATGVISFISPEVNATSQSILVKANFGNFNGNLLNQQLIQTRIIWANRPGIVVPVNAISRLGGETFVFVAENNEKNQLVAHQKPVKLGSIQGNNYQVLDGIKPGEKVITSGLLNLTDKAPIMPETEMPIPEQKAK